MGFFFITEIHKWWNFNSTQKEKKKKTHLLLGNWIFLSPFSIITQVVYPTEEHITCSRFGKGDGRAPTLTNPVCRRILCFCD